MSYSVREVYQARFAGPVTEVKVDDKLVGYVYFERTVDQWMAHTWATHPAASKEDGVRAVTDYAASHPDHELL